MSLDANYSNYLIFGHDKEASASAVQLPYLAQPIYTISGVATSSGVKDISVSVADPRTLDTRVVPEGWRSPVWLHDAVDNFTNAMFDDPKPTGKPMVFTLTESELKGYLNK